MDRDSNASEPVDLARLGRILEAYGADPEAWPAAERDAALALLARSAEARALRERAARLDRLLDRAPALEPSPELEARVLAAANQASPSWRRRLSAWTFALWPFGPVWRPATVLALAALFGVTLGTVAPLPSLVDGAHRALLVEDVSMLTFGPDLDPDLDPDIELEEQP
ncbi:MAG: hypothetical protein O7A68_01650 [Alphaproteobacteria bacterium]|nr:hypothetical protein [Alphaproteobacteria bacterium]